MTLGFTGSQHGATPKQLATVGRLLEELPVSALHHGGCIGADSQVHSLALLMDIALYVHPGPAFNLATDCLGASVVYSVKPNLVRNKDIVAVTDALIATPRSSVEVLRSGTWATVRYAGKLKRRMWLVKPDGTLA